MDLGFVLLQKAARPDSAAVIETAAKAGLTLTAGDSSDDGPAQFEVEGIGTLMVMVIDAAHPDVPTMASGPLSPDPAPFLEATAHAIVTLVADTEGVPLGDRDRAISVLVAATARGLPSVAAMLGHGTMFYQADLFCDLALAAAEEHEVPVELVVDITVAREDEERMSFLTHGLQRYDREEFYMTAPLTGTGALDFLLMLVRWMIVDPDKHLPTGETLGRDENERIEIQRVDSPLGEGPQVIKLDLP